MNILLLAIAVFGGYFVKGLCGFANMLVFGTILSFSRDTVDITPFDLVNIIFLCDDIFRTVLYSVMGIFTAEVLKTALMLYPVMLAGLFSGMVLSRKVNEKAAKILVSVILAASGVSLVILNFG